MGIFDRLFRKKEKNYINSIGMKFALISAGKFIFDSQFLEPAHKVRIKPFYLGVYPVTLREWKEVTGDKPPFFNDHRAYWGTPPNFEDEPVVMVSWNDVQEFIKKLNEKECTNKYRLPSDAEWEYAWKKRVGSKAISYDPWFHGHDRRDDVSEWVQDRLGKCDDISTIRCSYKYIYAEIKYESPYYTHCAHASSDSRIDDCSFRLLRDL